MKKDTKVFNLIRKEKQRQMHGIELIASENFVSDQVLKAMGSVMTNKYAEGYPGKRYYGGCQIVDQTEEIAIARACELFNATYANVQPHSGAQANMAVMLTCLKPGDTFMGLDLAHGGHLSHGSPVNSSGILYNPVAYQVSPETGRVDYDNMEKVALEKKPKLIIAGASAYSRDWDYKRMREIADKVGAILMADVSHPSGLIARGILNDPLDYCHIITTTTHKTLRGPRGGMILMRDDFENPWGLTTPKGEVKMMSALLNSAVFPGVQGGPLEHVIASKAVAFGEALKPEFKEYQKQIVANAQALATGLQNQGFRLVSGGTDNHLMLIDVKSKGLTGKEAETMLDDANVTVNKNTIPFETESPSVTSGIRIGTPAVTSRGMKEAEMDEIAAIFETVLLKKDQEQAKEMVKALTDRFPLYED